MQYHPKIILLFLSQLLQEYIGTESKTAKDAVYEYFTYKSLFHGAQTNQTMS